MNAYEDRSDRHLQTRVLALKEEEEIAMVPYRWFGMNGRSLHWKSVRGQVELDCWFAKKCWGDE